MRVHCHVVGADSHHLELAADATYGDILTALEFTSHEATVLVDGQPVPDDAPVDTDTVEVLRLIKGG